MLERPQDFSGPDNGAGWTGSVSPAGGQTIGFSHKNSPQDLLEAVRRAREAALQWAALPVGDRVRAVRRIKAHLMEHAEGIAALISKENGKTRIEALATEVLPAVMALDYYTRQARSFLKPVVLAPASLLLFNKWSRIFRVPWGVIGIISPWNYPFSIPFSEVVMGLLAGNGVILKTASNTQLAGREIESCMRAAGLPDGLFSFINLSGSEAGNAFMESGIDKLFFTGSVAAGKKLMAGAAETLTPLNLELGGNDAMLVCEDADLERASWGAVWAGLQNCGQSCAGVERIYVHESVYGPFMEKLKARVESLRVGEDIDFGVDMGAMTSIDQMETVRKQLEDALQKGAEIVVQSGCPPDESPGNFLPATLLAKVNHDMLVMKDETFGPVLAAMKVRDMEEAIALANDSVYGLTGSVWSKNSGKAERIAQRIRAGVVTINDHLVSHGMPETPWGGVKASGFGRSHGRIGFNEMTQPQVVVHDALSFAKKNLWWHPYSEELYRGLWGTMKFFYGQKLRVRLSGFRPMLKVLPRIFGDR
ncbi:MAG: aldehyde dehydrogenase family protein [Syntrophobacteraceae bacterium]|nr:aldehyde dehydrogenase family protein [Syntrophobacteraceae bacterium]